jgi:putative ABC transport system permease protein
MWLHLLKPIWKRKSRNVMLSLELLLAFIIVFAIAAVALRYAQLYRLPVGFSPENVWAVEIQFPEGDESANSGAQFEQFTRTLNAMPEVENTAFARYAPYTRSRWSSEFFRPDTNAAQPALVMQVSDNFFATVSMKTLRGRWFGAADAGALEAPAVINAELARQMFPGQDPLGQLIHQGKGEELQRMRVVGVFDDFRNRGEFMTPAPFIFTRYAPSATQSLPRALLLKLQPGTPRMFEAKLNTQLKLLRNDWGYRITPMPALRQDMLSSALIPLIVLAVIASFMLLMVAFGLFGVLWQNTARRIPEIGLRRAVGASARLIYLHIIVEQWLLSGLAMTVGVLLLLQLPLSGVFGAELNWTVFGAALLMAITTLLVLSTLCALYPAWRASRMSPTQALRYE